MDGPTTNQNNQVRKNKTADARNSANTTSFSSATDPSGFEQLPPPPIEVKNLSNRREELPYLIFPVNKDTESRQSKPPILVVNGMNMTSEAILNMGQSIANKFGRSTLMIPNNTEGVAKDIRNCVASAFSSKIGVTLENGAASHLAQNLVNRLNDNEPVELIAYSQGTLITSNVLTELRTFLIQSGRKDIWDNFANRIDLKTYGAATHIWPKGVGEVKEYRHTGDPVAAIGNSVTAIQFLGKLSVGDLKSEFATQIKLPVFKEAHSIINYLESSNFYLKELQGLDPETQTKHIIDSISRGEFSANEYNQIIQGLTLKGFSGSSKVDETNHSIKVARQIVKEFAANEDLALLLSSRTTDILTNAASQMVSEKTPLLQSLLNKGKLR